MRLPFTGPQTLETASSNFREIARWADELPISDDRFVPYFFEYQSDTDQEEFDVNLFELMHADYGMDLVPTGLWIVGAECFTTIVPDDAVGMTVGVRIYGDSFPNMVRTQVGYSNSEAPFEVITDIDFTAEEVTKEWFLPSLNNFLDEINASSCKLVRIQDASEDIRIEAVGFYSIFDDPTASPLLEFTPMPVSLRVWAYRLTDVFGMSNSIEPVTA